MSDGDARAGTSSRDSRDVREGTTTDEGSLVAEGLAALPRVALDEGERPDGWTTESNRMAWPGRTKEAQGQAAISHMTHDRIGLANEPSLGGREARTSGASVGNRGGGGRRGRRRGAGQRARRARDGGNLERSHWSPSVVRRSSDINISTSSSSLSLKKLVGIFAPIQGNARAARSNETKGLSRVVRDRRKRQEEKSRFAFDDRWKWPLQVIFAGWHTAWADKKRTEATGHE